MLESGYKIRLPPSGLVVKSRLQQQLYLILGKNYLFQLLPSTKNILLLKMACSIQSFESSESIGYIGYIVHTGNRSLVK